MTLLLLTFASMMIAMPLEASMEFEYPTIMGNVLYKWY
jgi:hypothetical protein